MMALFYYLTGVFLFFHVGRLDVDATDIDQGNCYSIVGCFKMFISN